MEELVADLLLAPFKEMVQKGQAALENAGCTEEPAAQRMIRAAQSLAKEGERALRKIEPVCHKQTAEYGSRFADAVKEQDEIAQYRTQLNDLLWEFDDYVEVDGFDADKFADLQALSRKAAPRILDILMRMKVEAPRADLDLRPPLSRGDAENSSGRAQSLHSSAKQEGSRSRHDHRNAAVYNDGHGGYYQHGNESNAMFHAVESQLSSMMGTQAGPELGLEDRLPEPPEPPGPSDPARNSSRYSQNSSLREPVPTEPSADPWQVTQPHSVSDASDYQNTEGLERRQRLSSSAGSQMEPVSPLSSMRDMGSVQLEPVSPLSTMREMGFMISDASHEAPGEYQRRLRSDSEASSRIVGSNDSLSLTAAYGSLGSVPSPAKPLHRRNVSEWNLTAMTGGKPLAAVPESSSSTAWRDSHASSTGESRQSSVFDGRGKDATSRADSPSTPDYRASAHSGTDDGPRITLTPANDPRAPEHPDSRGPVPTEEQPGLEPVSTVAQNDQDGLIPVVPNILPMQAQLGQQLEPQRQLSCAIGLDSSFYKFKGFCDGAKESIKGGECFKKTRVTGMGASYLVAKCQHCSYEMEWSKVEKDMKKRAKYQVHGVGFRLSVLWKSHLPSSYVDEQLYACIFCIAFGRTVEESDPTVFFSQQQFFAHVARHPRPLPRIPNLIVAEGKEVHPAIREIWDLWLPNPPAPSAITPDIKKEILRLPTAIGTESFTPSSGLYRLAPDSARPLQFPAKARIVGIEFPDKYKGEWAVGWFDNEHAPFPVNAVALNPPPKDEMQVQGTSPLQAVARWKWHPRDGAGFLRFNKGDLISNIGWMSPEHWCWYGTNPKGKWGVFPKSHIDLTTVSQDWSSSEHSSTHSSHEHKKSSNLFSKMSMRSRGSSSHEMSQSPRSSIY